ncbi:hypothetical protein [Actinopolyspora lacussalsi]|uniref:hypothetical protein n=1 Tax=Actinopolyspora righensis TaxID=995060 RepID=UPI0011144A54|nr:hypothetical protein [Actinopolyspora righensis]
MSDVTAGARIREDDILPRNSIIVRAGYVSGFQDLFQIVFSLIGDLRADLFTFFVGVFTSGFDGNDVSLPRSVGERKGRLSSACGAKWSFG